MSNSFGWGQSGNRNKDIHSIFWKKNYSQDDNGMGFRNM